MSSAKALKKKIAKRAKQKKNIQVKNSIRLKQAKTHQMADAAAVAATAVVHEAVAVRADESADSAAG